MRQGSGVALAGVGGRTEYVLRFAGHFLEMTVAMMLGMGVLGGACRVILDALGVPDAVVQAPEASLLIMGITMTVPMAGWMRFRGHGWAGIIEMSAAMLVPVIVAIPFTRGGGPDGLPLLPSGAICGFTCGVMMLAMVAVMVRRRHEYVHVHGM